MNGERGRVARGADLHGFERGHAVGDRHDAAAGDARVLGITAVDGLAEAATVDQHRQPGRQLRVPGADDFAGQVDAAVERVAAQDLAGAGCGQGILVIDRRVADLDDDVALGQVVEPQLGQARNDLVVAAVDAKGAKRLHHALLSSQTSSPWAFRRASRLIVAAMLSPPPAKPWRSSRSA